MGGAKHQNQEEELALDGGLRLIVFNYQNTTVTSWISSGCSCACKISVTKCVSHAWGWGGEAWIWRGESDCCLTGTIGGSDRGWRLS